MENYPPGGVPIIKIDGLKVRRLREEKGLTQLYVATVVGVTTDTISRWENRRYPTIKKENALKLAEALEVELADIREQEESLGPEEGAGTGEPAVAVPAPTVSEAGAERPTERPVAEVMGEATTPPAKTRKTAGLLLLAALALLTLMAIGISWWRGSEVPFDISVSRSLPRHSPPGEPFPVLIIIETSPSEPASLIVKEILPPECRPLKGQPEFTAVNRQEGSVKWLSKLAGSPTVLAYVATSKAATPLGRQLVFGGTVTTRQGDSGETSTGGENTLTLEPYHWADANKDGRIDDDEILSVYDTYGAIPSLDINMEQIEDIWSAKGYSWDSASGRYVTTP